MVLCLTATGIAWHAGPAAQGGYCSPPALGAPCALGGSTTQGHTEPLPGLELGNPVHLGSGNKYQLDVDLPPGAYAPGLELVRHYNSLSTQGSALGRNWSLSYDVRLVRRSDGWRVRQGDGSLRRIPPPERHGQGFMWPWPNGRQLHFDAQGHLTGIQEGRRLKVRIHRHAAPHRFAGMIDRVETAHGLSLLFHYGEHDGNTVLEAVDTPLGRFLYRYGAPAPGSGHRAPRLDAVQRPDGMRRLYHYEAAYQSGNPYTVTGISIASPNNAPRRLSTWKYDRHGRVIELWQHGRTLPVLRIDYVRPAHGAQEGLTRVYASNGRRQDIRFRRIKGDDRLVGRVDPAEGNESRHTYDTAGRITALDGMMVQRGPTGDVIGLVPAEPGWPALSFRLEGTRAGYSWFSAGTGRTRVLSGVTGRPGIVQYANGDTLHFAYDPQGRPIRLEETLASTRAGTLTTLQWRGQRLVRVQHPAESETTQYDAQGRVTERVVLRPADGDTPAIQFRDAFEYDPQGRLLRHSLPEGGALHYEWRDVGRGGGKLAALHWEDSSGRRVPVFASSPTHSGYRYGNGLTLVTGASAGGHADRLVLAHGEKIWWRQQRMHNAAGRVVADFHDFPQEGHHDHSHYTYDARSRLVGAQHGRPGFDNRSWHAWHADGGLAAMNINDRSTVPAIQRDAAGLPTAVGPYDLRYGPGRRLQTVTQRDTGRQLAHYRHNAFGYRISKRTSAGTTHYLYVQGRLVAEAGGNPSDSPVRVTRRYLYAGLTPVGMIEYPSKGPPRLYAVHSDLSGAPRLLTDAARNIRWLASYSPTGKAERIAGDLDFPLRLPGQYEDRETGWHDNLLRTYAAEFGQFLEPDPVGPLPGTDTYGYARQQPWRYADPFGLVLFAFDGTRYSADTQGNVWKLAQAYRGGGAHYHSGPGNSSFLNWDAVVAWRAGRILENQWQALLTAVELQPSGTVMPIDIIGFSRGAALARHFGNRIAAHVQRGVFSVTDPLRGTISACVDMRFMGLFDTVAQFGVGGSHNHLYDFGVAEMWSWVAHAVALHEHRWAFPLVSADAGGAGNIVEAPFIGAHADIGGGLALYRPLQDGNGNEADTAQDAESDLADVALAWMHWQALAATVPFEALAEADTHVDTPWLRDLRSPFWRTAQRGDRAVSAPSGVTRHSYQDADPRLGRSTRDQVEAFIHRVDAWRSQAGETVGSVDMKGYARWLEETLGWAPG